MIWDSGLNNFLMQYFYNGTIYYFSPCLETCGTIIFIRDVYTKWNMRSIKRGMFLGSSFSLLRTFFLLCSRLSSAFLSAFLTTCVPFKCKRLILFYCVYIEVIDFKVTGVIKRFSKGKFEMLWTFKFINSKIKS